MSSGEDESARGEAACRDEPSTLEEASPSRGVAMDAFDSGISRDRAVDRAGREGAREPSEARASARNATETLEGEATAKSFWFLRVAWRAAPWVIVGLATSTLIVGVLPTLVAEVGRTIVDTVVRALGEEAGWARHKSALWRWIALEAGLVASILAGQRGIAAGETILRSRLANTVTDLILRKALTLHLEQFEDPDVHDRLTRARRDAGVRPFYLVSGAFHVARNAVSFVVAVAVLARLSWWMALVVVAAGLPVFVAELRFSQRAFDQQRKRTPDERERAYLEAVVSREDYAKEVQIYRLGERFLGRLRTITARIEREEKTIAIRRNVWGFVLNLFGTLVFYGAYVWIVRRTVNEHLSLGEMTMYLAIFRQAQSGVTSGLAALGLLLDNRLYLRDLEAFLNLPVPRRTGSAVAGPDPRAGLVIENLSFTYPGAVRPALERVSFRLPPGEMVALVGLNGSGKTTLLKLVTRLYEPPEGAIFLEGLDVRSWDVDALRGRFAFVFQDFVRFKMSAGENIGAGDEEAWDDETRWRRAAEQGLAHEFIEALPGGYHARLGKWFRGGTELSGGQWQKIALSRAFMREHGSILVLDEPTAALDPDAERGIFEHVRAVRGKRSVLLVSHRFGSVRLADRIVVLDRGRVAEQGTHEELMSRRGLYHHLFTLQAAGYVETEPRGHERSSEMHVV